MTDEWLARRLLLVNRRADPNPEFADELYAQLAAELGLDAGTRVQHRPHERGNGRGRSRLGPKLLLVAAAIAGSVAVSAAAGGFIHRGQPDQREAVRAPHVCELIAASEIAAIVGAPVMLAVSESVATTPTASTSFCRYEYGRPIYPGGTRPNILLSLTRYADPVVARAQVGAGIHDYRAIFGLGDAAALYVNPPTEELFVLDGADVLSVGALTSGVAGSMDRAQMEEVARIILARLRSR